MVEFALVLPLLLLLVFGIIEAGRLLFLYSAVVSSSREAARYGSAAGEITGYIPHYGDCAGIQDAAIRIGKFAGVSPTDVTISYDHGPGSGAPFAICPIAADQYVRLADRVVVQVVAVWRPLIPLVNFREIPISAITRRTIIKDVTIQGTPPSPVIPTIAFVLSEQTVDEGVGKVSVMLQLSAATDKTVTVPYSLDGTALPGVDYTVTPNPVVLLPGDTIAEIQIDIVDDDVDEDAETAVLIMGSPTNAVKGSPSVHIATIEDNDDPPVVSFSNTAQSHPEDVDGLVMVQLSHPSSRDITVDYNVGGDAQGGVDYSLTSSPITIPAMDTSFPIVIDVVDDLIDEEDELVILTIVGAVNATVGSPDVHTYTIEDNDDPPDVFFTWESQTGDHTVEKFTVEVQLSIESSKDITVPFNLGGSATLGVDYTIDSNQYFIPPGDLTASLEITMIKDLDDDDVEGDETITLMMGPPTNARKVSPFKHTITITSDAMPPSVYFSPETQTSDDSVSGKLTVMVLLSAAASDPVTVPFSLNGTATRDVDYSIIGNSVNIPAGGAGTSIQVTLYQDAIDEDDETIEIMMGVPINATKGSPNTHTITIIDDDPEPQLYFTSNGQTVDEDAGIVTITAQLDVMSGKQVTVPFIVFGSAELGSDKDYTITASPVIIPAGFTSVDISVDIIDDGLIELNEDVIVTLGTPTNATLASPTTHTVTIKDNEPNCPAPTGLPFFGSNTNLDVLTWTLQTPSPLVPVNLVEVTFHWPVDSAANLTGITFGNPIYTGNAAPPFLSVTTPSPLWSGAFDTRDLLFIFNKNPKSVSGDFYQIIATFEGCPPIAGSISSELP